MNSRGMLEPNHRILVVDDNQAIHDDLRKILLGEVETQAHLQDDEALLFGVETVPITRFEIDSAYQGEEGLAKVEQSLAEGRPYAMAFVDVRMPPGWDGVETIARLWGVYENLQVVVCTAYSDYSWNDIHRRLGQSENLLILKKPFDNIEVIQLAHALTRKWLVSRQAQARLEDLDELVAERTKQLQMANDRIKKEFEEKAAAEMAFRTVFESSPIGIALSDLQGRYVDVNQAMEELMGRPKNLLTGKQPEEVGWIADAGAYAQIRRTLQAGGGVDSYELTYQNPKSGEGTALVWARPVAIAGVGYWLCFTLDISERKRMEEELVRARLDADAAAQVKSEFLANMSHEIRTPLNGILGLSVLLEEESVPEALRPMMSLIRTSGEVLRRVLDDVLDYSKIESGKLELEDGPFDLRACLEWSLDLVRQTAEEKGLMCRLLLDERLPRRLTADATRLRQVTANLMSNAVKFTDHGSVELTAEPAEGEAGGARQLVRVSVRDTGIGIPEERMNRLFQSFSQVDASTSRRYGGTGLGLAICKRLVEMMGGEIGVKSRFGEGTTFEFTFAAGTETADEPGAEAAVAAIPPGLRVLVAEDNKVNQMVTLRLLQKMGCEAELAADGASAIERVATRAYDVVLMDVNMPGVDGLAATRNIRSMARGSGVPIVALTASASSEDKARCLAAGMDDYLPKPIEIHALRRALERWGSGRAPGAAEDPVAAALG